jgi:predicted dehydrogenase
MHHRVSRQTISGAEPMTPIRTALVGLSGVGTDYLASILSDDRFDLKAVGDGNAERLRLHTESIGVRAYEDFRSLIVETAHGGLDLLVIAQEPFQSVEFADMAAAHGIPVLHKTPWARHVDEGRRLIHGFEVHGQPLIVSRWWRHEPAYAGLRDLAKWTGHVFAATASVSDANTADGWRGDSVKAGGGVLLNAAYDIVDMLVSVMGMPERVFARCHMRIEPGSPRPYDTEDFAVVTLQFQQERTASICATRAVEVTQWHLSLHGTNATVEVSPECFIVAPIDGGEPTTHRVWTRYPVVHALGAIAETRRDDKKPNDSAARNQLNPLAVIQAAYLSAKTGEPESPLLMLE